jgi:hypothetical protein
MSNFGCTNDLHHRAGGQSSKQIQGRDRRTGGSTNSVKHHPWMGEWIPAGVPPRFTEPKIK